VVNCSSTIPESDNTNSPRFKNGCYLTMSIKVISSNLWTSTYNDYQQRIFEIIRTKHEDEGLNFVQITKYLVENNFKTPRGKEFTQGHTWSIYNKKKRSIERFSRTYKPEITNVGIDIISSTPNT
jgi:hypothetical protein